MLQLKHTDRPVPTFKVIGIGGRRSRIDALVHPPETTFVGREAELNALTGALGDARRKNGRAVGVCAGAGEGKSRLLFELRQKHSLGRFRLCRGALRLSREEHPVFRRPGPGSRALRYFLERYGSGRERKAQGCIQAPRARSPGAWTASSSGAQHRPRERRSFRPSACAHSPQAVFSAVREIVLARTCKRPLILTIEDVHWIDQLSNDFLAYLVETIAELPVLLIVTYREQYRPAWLHHAYASEIRLEPLSAADAAKIVEGCDIQARLAYCLTWRCSPSGWRMPHLFCSPLWGGGGRGAKMVGVSQRLASSVIVERINRALRPRGHSASFPRTRTAMLCFGVQN